MAGWIFKRGVNGAAEFWTGDVDGDGDLVVSDHRCDAFVFDSSGAALQCAETHNALRDSEVWKVVPR